MSYSEYADQIEEQCTLSNVEDAFYVAPIEQWDLSDFEDVLQ